MNKVEAALLSFLSKAAQGEAEMPRHILEDFGKSAQKALEKQFTNENRDFYLRMSNVGRPLCQLQMQAKNVKPETPTYDFKMRIYKLCIILKQNQCILAKSPFMKTIFLIPCSF